MHLDKSGQEILRDLKKYIAECTEVERVTTKGPAAELARYYIEVKDFYESLHDISKELTKLKDQMAYQDVPQAFEREGTSTLTIKEGYRVTVSALVRASTKDMAIGIEWCKTCKCGHNDAEHDGPGGCNIMLSKGTTTKNAEFCDCPKYTAPNAGLVKETINAQTLAAFVRAEMEEGREVPDDIFTVSVGQNTSVTKVK
jgi:hypothetical protein